ncbi:MAG: hypothetical protein JO356_11550 [Acidobacteria bacterium]|nr:hypothetical protein [Acidobacteriota bacterium]
MVKNTPVLLISCSLVLMNCHRAHATDEWHVEATPGVISQEIHLPMAMPDSRGPSIYLSMATICLP